MLKTLIFLSTKQFNGAKSFDLSDYQNETLIFDKESSIEQNGILRQFINKH